MTDQPLDPTEMVALAQELVERHHLFDAAASILEWAAALDPLDSTQQLRARLLGKLGRHEEAKAILDDLAESDDPGELNDRAIVAAGCLDHGRAARMLTRAIERAPDRQHLWANRGLVHFCAGDYDEAASDLVRSLIVGFGVRDLRYGCFQAEVADLRAPLGDLGRIRAEAEARDSLALGIIEIWALIVKDDLGRARRALSRLPGLRGWRDHALRAALLKHGKRGAERRTRREVEKYYYAARHADPTDLGVLVAFADERRWTSPGHRLPDLDAVLDRAPGWIDGWVEAARAAAGQGDKDGALARADRALALDPERFGALHVKAQALGMRREFEAALGVFDLLISTFGIDDPDEEDGADEELDPDWERLRGEVLCERARVKYELRDLEGARRDYDLAARPDTADWDPFVERAKFLAYQRLWAEALEDLDEAGARLPNLDPGQPQDPEARIQWFHRLRARLRERTGDLDGARAERERAARMDRERDAFVQAQARKQRREKARKKKGRR